MDEIKLREIFAAQIEAMPGLYVFFLTPGINEGFINTVKWEVSKLDQLVDHLNNNGLVFNEDYKDDIIPHFVFENNSS